MSGNSKYINIDEPRYDQNTYIGRAKHFFITTNPLNILVSNTKLEEAKNIVEAYRKNRVLPPGVDEEKLWRSKVLMDSAYHPDTKEKMFILGRMSAQVPCNLLITAGMLTWYRTTAGTFLWQWINQSFNATVNYTNRSGDKPISINRLGVSYLIATSSATATALYLNSLVKNMSPLVGRFVPFLAVAAANCVNLPFMRSSEIQDGIQLINENGEKVGTSSKAAKIAIAQVVVSRIFMATPGMIFPPIIMNLLEKRRPALKTNMLAVFGIQLVLIGTCLTFATPMCCAIFPQKSSIKVGSLEDSARDGLYKKGYKDTDLVYYNKGL